MEKKTIGGFIAALRKASGMTQKDLADRLNVSDKAVSRWERDECAPDLSLIPVIADIFGVTADELLRGERRQPSASGENSADTERDLSKKSKKQIKYMLKQALMRYRLQSLAVAMLALVGFITAAIINAFDFAQLGLGIALIIYVIAAVLLVIFTMFAVYQVDEEEFDSEDTNTYKKSVAYSAWFAASAIFIILCITMPLTLVQEVYLGLAADVWFVCALICVVVGMIICVLARYILTNALCKRGIISLTKNVWNNRKLALKTSVVLAMVMAVTFIGQMIFNTIANSEMLFVNGRQFDNYADFKEYMETPINGVEYGNSTGSFSINVAISDSDYYDENVITDKNGKVLCKFVNRNMSVVLIEYSGTKDQLPITVYTNYDISIHSGIMNAVNLVWIAFYVIEIIVATAIYLKKHVK